MTDRETYLARADEARAEAEAATLDNVRDRCLRAEAAWTAMAARAERNEKMRATLLAQKAAQLDTPAIGGRKPSTDKTIEDESNQTIDRAADARYAPAHDPIPVSADEAGPSAPRSSDRL